MVTKSTILQTAADQLVDFVMSKEKVTIEETAKRLKIPTKTVQALVDFLVEEKVLGIEYKFTTPYIYLSKKDSKEHSLTRKKEAPVLISKEEFYEKSKSRDISYQKIGGLWKKYLEKQLGGVREQFFERAKEKKIHPEKIEGLWQKYLTYL